jgi:DNA-binding transcriptional MerR regulator
VVQPDGVSWKDWVNARLEKYDIKLDGCQRMLAAHQEGTDKALEAAKEELERRLESMNEFREQLEAQSRTFLTREYYESRHTALAQKIDNVDKMQAAAEARSKVYAVVVAATISVLVGLTIFIITGR